LVVLPFFVVKHLERPSVDDVEGVSRFTGTKELLASRYPHHRR